MGGFNQYSLYVTIPSEMVKKLGITKNSLLVIDVVDDAIITVRKLDNKSGFTKRELEKIQNPDKFKDDDYHKEEDNKILKPTIPDSDFKNPLDKLDDI